MECEKLYFKSSWRLKQAESIILTEKDYRKILYTKLAYKSILNTLFSSFNILFLGASLADPETKMLLGYIHSVFSGHNPAHFALMSNESVNPVEAKRWLKDFNIKIITYDPKNNHSEVDRFLKMLITEVNK